MRSQADRAADVVWLDAPGAGNAEAARAQRPPSATAPATALAGFAAAVLAMGLLRDVAWEPTAKVLVAVAGTAAAMVALDVGWYRTPRNAGSGLAPERINAFSANRIVRKLIGFAATLGALAACYAAFPEYAGDFYDPVRRAAGLCLPWLVVATPLYVAFVDRRQREPEDAYAQLGALLTAQGIPETWSGLAQHARGWLVKGFFLPLMFVYLSGSLAEFWQADFSAAASSFEGFYTRAYATIFLFDLLFAVVGYTLTLRLLDNQIRSAEPTMAGWVACLVCYQPFWHLISAQYLAYDTDGTYWGTVSHAHPILYAAWGSLILACLVVYSWATVSFGLRFSNLTHRGIITSGPYRWTKHPAYITKCLSFWLISAPFLSEAGLEAALTQSLLLLAANGLYVARAVTEERHLAKDPVYRDYQAYIRERGCIASGLRLMRRMRTRAPSGETV